jgi:hypothetical protein
MHWVYLLPCPIRERLEHFRHGTVVPGAHRGRLSSPWTGVLYSVIVDFILPFLFLSFFVVLARVERLSNLLPSPDLLTPVAPAILPKKSSTYFLRNSQRFPIPILTPPGRFWLFQGGMRTLQWLPIYQ